MGHRLFMIREDAVARIREEALAPQQDTGPITEPPPPTRLDVVAAQQAEIRLLRQQLAAAHDLLALPEAEMNLAGTTEWAAWQAATGWRRP